MSNRGDMTTSPQAQAMCDEMLAHLTAELALCEAATPGPYIWDYSSSCGELGDGYYIVPEVWDENSDPIAFFPDSADHPGGIQHVNVRAFCDAMNNRPAELRAAIAVLRTLQGALLSDPAAMHVASVGMDADPDAATLYAGHALAAQTIAVMYAELFSRGLALLHPAPPTAESIQATQGEAT